MDNNENSKFRIPSGWTPQPGTSQGIDTFLNKNTEEIFNIKRNKVSNNLPPEEKRALKELMENNNIVIKPADKGGAIVIQDKEKYKSECLRQLNNREHYR